MPFLAPFAPALIKGGIGLGASLIGSKLAGGTPSGDKGILAQQRQNAQIGSDSGSQMLRLAGQSYNPVVNYWSKMLSPNRGDMTAALAPEINQISEGYGAQTRAASELMPRGGGRATLLQDLPYRQTRDTTTLLQTARPQAAKGLLDAGTSAANTGVNALYGSTAAGRSLLDYSAAKRASDQAMGSQIGGGLFSLLKGSGVNGDTGIFGKLDDWFKNRGGPSDTGISTGARRA